MHQLVGEWLVVVQLQCAPVRCGCVHGVGGDRPGCDGNNCLSLVSGLPAALGLQRTAPAFNCSSAVPRKQCALLRVGRTSCTQAQHYATEVRGRSRPRENAALRGSSSSLCQCGRVVPAGRLDCLFQDPRLTIPHPDHVDVVVAVRLQPFNPSHRKELVCPADCARGVHLQRIYWK
jgi:hypothetical protein